MKTAKHAKSVPHRRGGAATRAADPSTPVKELASVPAIIASAFGKLDIERRARLLGRLLGSVGPLALAVVGGGAFAKYLGNARWPEIPISLEDAAHATSSQVHERSEAAPPTNAVAAARAFCHPIAGCARAPIWCPSRPAFCRGRVNIRTTCCARGGPSG